MSGVWKAVAFSEGCAVIFHSPLGCVHVASDMDLGSQFRIMAEGSKETENAIPLISSNIREKDTIFGGISRLKQCIDYVIHTYEPECLFIASSCVAGVIGDDVEQEAEEAEEKYGIPVICVPYVGFLGGEYSDGYFKTADIIVDRFFTKKKQIPGKVLLIGDQMGPSGQYALEVKRILKLFGLFVEYQFPGYAPFDEWKNLTGAEWMVLLGGKGQSDKLCNLANKIKNCYGVGILTEQYPIGWENTRSWIHEIGVRLNKITLADQFYDNLSDKEKDVFMQQIKTCTQSPVYQGSNHQELINQADIFLTTNEILDIKTRQFFIPMMPMAGTNGEIFILRALYRLLCRYGNKGGIAYATI